MATRVGMGQIRFGLQVLLAALWLPGVTWACVYPAAIQTVTATLIDVRDTGGQVAIHHRARLRRTLAGVDPASLSATLASDLSRANLRAVDTVLAGATALADGKGVELGAHLTAASVRLREAVQKDCAQGEQAAAGGSEAQGAEHGARRVGVGTGTPLTFREGLTRLSVAFTIYAVFLCFVIALRRRWPARHDTEEVTEPMSKPLLDRFVPSPILRITRRT
ncbi:MAG: hypothetical protein AAF214_11670 [Pseudomonadota bacterium]